MDTKKVIKLFEEATAIIFDGELTFPVVEDNCIYVKLDTFETTIEKEQIRDSFFKDSILYIPENHDEFFEIEFLYSKSYQKTSFVEISVKKGIVEVDYKDKGVELIITDYDVQGVIPELNRYVSEDKIDY